MTTRRRFFAGAAKALLGGAAIGATALSAAAATTTAPKREMLHIEIGNDRWEPTPEEIENILKEVQLADMDPLGAIIATRDGVSITRI